MTSIRRVAIAAVVAAVPSVLLAGGGLHGWGTGIRNSLGLRRGNEKLLASCGGGAKTDPEACSMVIIEAVWTLLQAQK